MNYADRVKTIRGFKMLIRFNGNFSWRQKVVCINLAGLLNDSFFFYLWISIHSSRWRVGIIVAWIFQIWKRNSYELVCCFEFICDIHVRCNVTAIFHRCILAIPFFRNKFSERFQPVLLTRCKHRFARCKVDTPALGIQWFLNFHGEIYITYYFLYIKKCNMTGIRHVGFKWSCYTLNDWKR